MTNFTIIVNTLKIVEYNEGELNSIGTTNLP